MVVSFPSCAVVLRTACCCDQVTEDIEELSFNTAISALMVLTNHLMNFEKPPRGALEVS